MAEPFLYLDIDGKGIHAMILEVSFSKKKVLSQCHLQYDSLGQSEPGTNPFPAAMAAMAAKMDITACTKAVILIPALDVCFRNISLPFFNEKKIRQILPFELAPHLPLPEEPYVSDFILQDVRFVRDQQLILSASTLESDIRQWVDCLKTFNIKPLVITPKGHAAAVCFLKQRKEVANFILIHMGTLDITLTVVADRKPVIVRSFAATHYTAQELGAEFSRTLLGFRHRSGSDIVFDVFVAAQESSHHAPHITAALEKILAARLDPGPVTANTFEIVDSGELLSILSLDSQPESLFNFCRGQFGSDTFFHQYKTGIVSTAFLGLVLFGACVFGLHKDIALLEHGILMEKQAALAIYQKTFPGRNDGHIQAPLLLMQSHVKQALKKNGQNASKKELENISDIPVMDVLFELSDKITDAIDADLSQLILNNGRLIISGSTDNFNNVDKMKGLMEKSTLFKTVSISSAEAGKMENRVLFKFIIDM
ncbi:MAG: PilN domain-containing protein [Proteobacteria bacterium]|nr:PilN domain-containing protein [Pseudomonadota bacterium]